MDALHRRFLRPGDLAFDIGAHVGDRTASFRRLGARVVAVEPQPDLAKLLRILHGRDQFVTIEPCAVGQEEGRLLLRLNVANPTVATGSEAFVAAAQDAPGWEGQRWTESIEVPMTSLDSLIARHGTPAFIKIDVEGFEPKALAGLSVPVPALSFEFTTIQREAALEALHRVRNLGAYSFNAAIGESQTLVHPAPLTADSLSDWLENLPHDANSGDVYASLEEERITY